MLFLRKLLRLPSPIDLGWSKTNALPMRQFTPDTKEHTWEDWDVQVRTQHPYKYFFAETLPYFLKYRLWFPLYAPISQLYYYLISHLLPSRKYHWLDLRQLEEDPNSYDYYNWGWCSTDRRMVFALINLFQQFMEKTFPTLDCPTLQAASIDKQCQQDRDLYFEIKAIDQWWRIERKNLNEQIDKYQSLWHEAHKKNSPRKEFFWKKLQKSEKELEDQLDNILIRILKIRRYLWD